VHSGAGGAIKGNHGTELAQFEKNKLYKKWCWTPQSPCAT